jgi:serine protease Do
VISPSNVWLVKFRNKSHAPRFNLRGTGFVVGDGNLLVTNAHVLQTAAVEELGADLVIQPWDRNNELRMRKATVIEVDKLHDLALLRFRGDSLPALA